MLKNIDMKVEGNMLVLRIDLSVNHGLTKSGRSVGIATTSGNRYIPEADAFIGINVYRPVKPELSARFRNR